MVAAPDRASATEELQVELGDRSYPIYIGQHLLEDQLGELTKHARGKKVLVVSNDVVAPLYMQEVMQAFTKGGKEVHSVVIPDGEQHKDMETLMTIIDAAMMQKLDRKCTFVALGGGVVGDMCGFAAAIYQRGVDFIQIPTTLMAMVDSAVGGKTAVNHPRGKNMIGAFYQPQSVCVDIATLNSLPDREYCSGIAEIIKYGLIRDKQLFEWLEQNMEALVSRDPAVLKYAIKRSCENKAEIVAADEREAGIRATLNLGHTFGHAIETGLGYGEWLHGEAVGAGMCMAAHMSLSMGLISPALYDRAVGLVKRAKLPTSLDSANGAGALTVDGFLDLMSLDKKVANGELSLVLLSGPLGGCVVTKEYQQSVLRETVQEFVGKPRR